MATQPGTIEYLLEQLADLAGIATRKMFGEYALYCDHKVVALICDDQLFLKITDASTALLDGAVEGFPYPGAKPWYCISADQWEDREWLAGLIRGVADSLPLPKPKKQSAKR